MDQSNNMPWDGVVDAVKETVVETVKTVKKMLPWEGVDTTPKQKTFHNPSKVDVSTEARMKAAATILPHERMPDTQSKASNLAEIDKEIAIARKAKNFAAVDILTQERRKYTGANVQKEGFYSDTKLQKEYPTLAENSEKSVNTFMKEASQSIPEYKILQDFLTNTRSFPNIKTTYNDNVKGEFVYPGFFREKGSDLGSRGEIALSRSYATEESFSDSMKATLIHEMTHAADRQMTILYDKLSRKDSTSASEQQFLNAFKKYSKAESDKANRYISVSSAQVLAKKLAPEWYAEQEKTNGGYRVGSAEMRAHATGYSSKKDMKGDKAAPEHIDSSIATEFFVLLDLANRVSIDNTPKGR